MVGQPGFFDLDNWYAELSETGDPLERLAEVIDFEVFRPELVDNVSYFSHKMEWVVARGFGYVGC